MDLTLNFGMNKKYNCRVAANLKYRDCVFMCKLDILEPYFPVGGRVKYLETLEDALKRELSEELGVEIREVKYESFSESFFTLGDTDFHEHLFIYEVTLDADCITSSDESIHIFTRCQFEELFCVPSFWKGLVLDESKSMYQVEERVRTVGSDVCYRFDAENEFNVRVSAKIVNNGRILVDTSYGAYGHVVPIGGRLHFDEKIFEAINREVEEELSTPAKDIQLLGVTEDFFELENRDGTFKKIHFISFNFEVQVDIDKIVYADGCEGEWLPLDTFNALPMKLESFKKYTK